MLGLTDSSGTFVSFFVFYGWLQRLWPCTPPGCACTLCLPLKLVLLTVLDLCLFMPDPRLLDPVSLFLTDERSDAAVVGSGNKAMGTSPLLTLRSWCRTWGSITTTKSSRRKTILKRLHLRLGKKAMEKLMKPVEATLEGRGVR